MDASPLNMSDVNPDTVRGLSPDIVNRILQFKSASRTASQDIVGGKTAVTPPVLKQSERAAAETKLLDDLKKAEAEFDNYILDTTILERNPAGIKVKMTAFNDQKTGTFSEIRDLTFDFNDFAGKYEQKSLAGS